MRLEQKRHHETTPPTTQCTTGFEAAAKSENFGQTADVLCVTQGAVSKQIRLLEEHLGCALFERRGSTLHLTPEGKSYLAVIAQALDIIEMGSEHFYQQDAKETLTINIMPSLSTLWMFSRVNTFQQSHPNIVLRINSSDEEVDWYRQSMDLAIRCLPIHSKPKHAELLFSETLRLIIHPDLLSQHFSQEQTLNSISDLDQFTTINLKNRPLAQEQLFFSMI